MNTTPDIYQPTKQFKDAYQLGTEQIIQRDFHDVPVLVVPTNMKVVELNELAEKFLPRPRQLKQQVTLYTAESFLEYFNRFSNEHSTIFFNPETGVFKGYLDFHASKAEPEFLHHTCFYACPKTKEWNAWIENNNKKMDQEDFAFFIEENMKQIAEPNGAQMLEIASNLKATKNVDFKSAKSLSNGQVNFEYSEKINGQAGALGNLEIPQIITINIKPFVSGSPYVLQARFRYRIQPSGLQLFYTLIAPHLIVQDAVSDVTTLLKTGLTQGHLLEGII